MRDIINDEFYTKDVRRDNMIDFVKVGMKITKYRKQNKLTQDDIASKLYVSRQLVSKWENGTGIPSIDVLIELSKLFHISFEELLCLNEENTIDKENIFAGKDRMYVVSCIINGDIKVNLADVFYQLMYIFSISSYVSFSLLALSFLTPNTPICLNVS